MASRKILLNIFGPSTAGKSTVTDLLQKNLEGIYTVDFDVIKRQISGYYWKRDSKTAQQISFDTLASVARLELPIIALLPPPNESSIQKIKKIAEECGYKLFDIEITAPVDVLIERYQKRLEEIRKSDTSWKFKTLEEFKEKLKQSYFHPDGSLSFDSSQLTPEEILTALKEATGL